MSGKKVPSARTAALTVIDQTLHGLELQAALNHILISKSVTGPDRQLTAQLAYGYFRYQLRLEFIVSNFLSRNKNSLPGHILRALCLGTYEICFLSRIPDFATVHWYVEHIKKHANSGLTKMANAILRRVCREKEALFNRDFYAQDHPGPSRFLSRYYACPEWIVKLCLHSFSMLQTETLLEQSMRPPPVGLRLNPRVSDWSRLYANLSSLAPVVAQTQNGLALTSPPDIKIRKAEQHGLLTRQSLAAQEALDRETPAAWPQPVWDACAGRGLKTSQLLERGCSHLWASDIHPRKVLTCQQEIARLHLPGIPLFTADATTPPLGRTRPQSILLDVPCSGLGVLSRRPDIKAKRSPRDLPVLAGLQKKLLRSCLIMLPPGGRLVYISCTFNPDENEDLIRSVLQEKSGLGRLHSIHLPDPSSPLGEYFFTACIRN
ncbi:MAG: RsmB/NOP family class I SAM-dependent RNA methyltransferase [Desulfovermiculus sp.]